MLKLPEIYQAPNGSNLSVCFRETLDAKAAFYQNTSTENGKTYIEAVTRLRDRLLKEAASMHEEAEKLSKTKFKDTVQRYHQLADQTKHIGLSLDPIKDFVVHLLSSASRSATWGACPMMGPQWLWLQKGCCDAMDLCANLKKDFERENAVPETAKQGLTLKDKELPVLESANEEKKVLSCKREPSENFHMELRKREPKTYSK